jgi:hypothetical protein
VGFKIISKRLSVAQFKQENVLWGGGGILFVLVLAEIAKNTCRWATEVNIEKWSYFAIKTI